SDFNMQPLSKVFPKGNVIFGAPDNIAKRPTVAVKISQCIIEWADIESMLGMCLAILLDADRETALEMYAGVENRSSQFKMLESAARVKLADSPDLDIFTVLLNSIIRPSMRERDKLAHWCWGFCPELENALVLTQLHHKMAS